MTTGLDPLLARLGRVERRLAEHAAQPVPSGLTDPDPDGTERWEAGQVWAHIAEFPAYWLGQVRGILDARARGASEPVPFGRIKTDPNRIAAIERERHSAPAVLLRRVTTDLAEVRAAIERLGAGELAARGEHPTL